MEQVASLDLIRQMRRIQEVRQIIRLTLGLAVLPENMIVRGFRVLLQHARAEGNYIFNIVRPYLMYINTYWISRPWRRRRMCVHGSSQRTNNACESHNRQLRTTVGLHPNIYDFIRKYYGDILLHVSCIVLYHVAFINIYDQHFRWTSDS